MKGLALSSPAPKSPEPSAGDAQIPGGIGNKNSQMDTLEIGVEFQLDLKKDDLVILRELGAGNGGTVSKVMHPATKIIMARKVSALSLHTLRAPAESPRSGHPCRSKGSSAEEYRSRAAHHEGLQFAAYRYVLRSIPKRCWRCDNVYGIYGFRVSVATHRYLRCWAEILSQITRSDIKGLRPSSRRCSWQDHRRCVEWANLPIRVASHYAPRYQAFQRFGQLQGCYKAL